MNMCKHTTCTHMGCVCTTTGFSVYDSRFDKLSRLIQLDHCRHIVGLILNGAPCKELLPAHALPVCIVVSIFLYEFHH